VIAQINSSWTTRVRRDDLVTFHVDGTHGSAVAGLQDCRSQARVNTPKPVWNPDVRQSLNFFDSWQAVPEYTLFDNGFKTQWEAFIRHVAEDAPFRGTCWKAPRACSWSSARCRAGASGAGSTFRRLSA
jgi:predicted dehydrogenase